MALSSFSVGHVNWQQAAPLLKDVREKVFVCERRVPKDVEFDQNDANAYHILACDDHTQEPVATGRLLPSGDLGRIAVIKHYRQNSVDKLVINKLFNLANKLKIKELFIKCPLESVDYFSQKKFYRIGSVFMEAGRPKQRMACPLTHATYSKYYLGH